MEKSTLQRNIKLAASSLVLALAAAFGTAPDSAQAAYIVVVADPPFGAAYPNQGWTAQGALYIPDACYTEVQTTYSVGLFNLALGDNSTRNCAGLDSGVQLQDVQVSLYNGTPTNVFDTLSLAPYEAESFDEAYYGHTTLARLIDIDFFDGVVVGFHTTLSQPTPTHVPLGNDLSSSLQLQFSKDYEPVTERALGAAPSAFDPANCSNTIAGNGAILCVTGTTAGGPVVSGSVADPVSIGPTLTDAQYQALRAPEPGTLGLGVTALAAAWAVRRRRRGSAA
jgi:hypothetical protein